MLAMRDTSPAAAVAAALKAEVSLSSGDSELNVMANIWKSKSKSKNTNRKRFTDEQIRLLESMFETESRPEMEIKYKLANELGLHPRQVAIWFQNRRARSKSKLIEQEYNLLKRSYDNLASKFDSLKNENQRLLIQLQKLRNLMGKPQDPGKCSDEECDNMDTHSDAEEKINHLLDCNQPKNRGPLRDDSSENLEYVTEEADILKMAEIVPDGSFISTGNWCSFELNFESGGVLDHPNCSSEWWEI
ncbi:hypothetical protein RHMOL_Rhmol07G0092300 [Rhododendron molle]|uniref:Uncharacterized protein n=1 Tax=Rhododendron molle TaxID=49168 RepID=A0ACC0MZV7_RHOML|nr:hypothetical protein RHMOL_Rhmol07G0092300 [Rhododendron molle]